ncbi:hypothetical protein TEA_018710 [Camellia sinensis var. sinensis]|uniref:RING-type E3 ubiquitin transferase n=1 Tax=Camellia sinensis var. sinensis TaxID=542762 RepID=A0A4S4DKQ5_CAMSN|nr:hypothetical protein TEA_018710 [Camellia sinensis var. sinensis]
MEHKSFQNQAAWTFCLADEKNNAVSNFVRFHSNVFGGCVEMMVAVAAISFFAGVIIIFVIILHFFDTYVSQRYRSRHRAIVRPFRVVAPTQVNLSHESPRTGLEPIRAVVPAHENLIHESASSGFDQSIIDLLPKFVYKASPRHWLGDGGEAVECTVCQITVVEGNRVRLLNCMHLFHVDCIDRWLRLRSTCPNCRAEPRPQNWTVIAPPWLEEMASDG